MCNGFGPGAHADSDAFCAVCITRACAWRKDGEPGKDIEPENVAAIRRLYPQDEATGFKLGELRGAWRIDFPLANLKTPP
jgi:hypothetical protein